MLAGSWVVAFLILINRKPTPKIAAKVAGNTVMSWAILWLGFLFLVGLAWCALPLEKWILANLNFNLFPSSPLDTLKIVPLFPALLVMGGIVLGVKWLLRISRYRIFQYTDEEERLKKEYGDLVVRNNPHFFGVFNFLKSKKEIKEAIVNGR